MEMDLGLVLLGLTHSLALGRRPVPLPPAASRPWLLLTSCSPVVLDLHCGSLPPWEPTQRSLQEPTSSLLGP